MNKLTILLLTITSLTVVNAGATEATPYKQLTSLACRYEVEVDAEPGIPAGTPMEILRCSLKVVKTSKNYEIYVVSEKGVYHAGSSEKPVYKPAAVVRVATAKDCAYPPNSPMTLACEDSRGRDVLQSVLHTEEFSVSYTKGRYTPVKNQSAKVSIAPSAEFWNSDGRERINDCISSLQDGSLINFAIETSEDPSKSCRMN